MTVTRKGLLLEIDEPTCLDCGAIMPGSASETTRCKSCLKNKRQELKQTNFWRWKSQNVSISISKNSLKQIFESQDGLCGLTGRQLNRETMHLDHIIPKSRGGSDCISNLRWVVPGANHAKRDLTDQELADLCRDILSYFTEQ